MSSIEKSATFFETCSKPAALRIRGVSAAAPHQTGTYHCMQVSKISLRTSLVVLSTLQFCWTVEAADLETTPDLGSPALVDEGRAQFAQNCVYCHGNGGTGGKAGPIAGRDDLTPDYVFQTITNGKRAGSLVMPSWKESIDVPTRWALVAYIMSLRAKP